MTVSPPLWRGPHAFRGSRAPFLLLLSTSQPFCTVGVPVLLLCHKSSALSEGAQAGPPPRPQLLLRGSALQPWANGGTVKPRRLPGVAQPSGCALTPTSPVGSDVCCAVPCPNTLPPHPESPSSCPQALAAIGGLGNVKTIPHMTHGGRCLEDPQWCRNRETCQMVSFPAEPVPLPYGLEGGRVWFCCQF